MRTGGSPRQGPPNGFGEDCIFAFQLNERPLRRLLPIRCCEQGAPWSGEGSRTHVRNGSGADSHLKAGSGPVIRCSERVCVEKRASVRPIGDDRAGDENPPTNVVVVVTRQPAEHTVILGIGLLAGTSVADLYRTGPYPEGRIGDRRPQRVGGRRSPKGGERAPTARSGTATGQEVRRAVIWETVVEGAPLVDPGSAVVAPHRRRQP